MISLLNSERFQTEYKEFKDHIAQIKNPEMKKELEDLLSKLILEIKILDTYHTELVRGAGLPSTVTESKTKIAEIRKRISKRLEDWKQANA